MDGLMNKWMDRWMGGWKVRCTYTIDRRTERKTGRIMDWRDENRKKDKWTD